MKNTSTFTRRHLVQAAAGLAATSLATPLWAQAYPNRPVRLISGATAGSASDIIARAVAEKIQAELGQPVIVENRLGASGTIAVGAMLAAPADGHTVSVYTAAHTVVPLLSKVPYDPLKDISAVIPLAVVPNVLVVAPSKGFKTVQDLVAAAKAKPGSLNYASVGAGTATSMSAEKFRAATGIDAVHVPFKGSPEAVNETIAGRTDFFFAPLVSALPMIKAGRLQALAVATTKRSAQLPEVPTLAEAGIANSEYLFWIGMLVPVKTPREVVNRLNQATLKALATPEVRERLASQGAEPLPMSPEQFDTMIREEMAANAAIIKAAGIKID